MLRFNYIAMYGTAIVLLLLLHLLLALLVWCCCCCCRLNGESEAGDVLLASPPCGLRLRSEGVLLLPRSGSVLLPCRVGRCLAFSHLFPLQYHRGGSFYSTKCTMDEPAVCEYSSVFVNV